ncbi:hypothetical protein [Helicobacter pylori]|uniref:hypothetical protein n=1 Tax=Helicobacter pylori TaxID=210 RepID=UPI001EE48783|nr:hypothetical protein [Helicobacter pylori]
MAIRFGVIFIDNFRETEQQLRSILKRKSEINFIRFIEATASYTGIDFLELPTTIEITGFLVFQDDRSVTHLTDDPSATFNLKNYLLVLAKKFDCSVYYCENINTQKIEWISTNHSDFGEILHEFSDITFSSTNTNELPQFLANFKFSKSTYGIDKAEFSLSSLSLENMTLIDNLSTLKRNIKNTFDRYSWHGYSKIPQEKRITQIKKQVSEECKVNPFFHSWRVSSEQNRKVNKIAEDLKSGKIVGEKIIDNVFDINASYCFITPEDLKNLKERLFIQQNIDITHVINQKKGEAFDHILINDIKYNLLDNTFHFIFNVGNSLLKESSQLIIEVPREALDLENVDRFIENTLSSHRVCFCSEIHSVCSENSLICHLNQGSYIIDLHLIDD